MKAEKLVLGLDTSNYTTSAALMTVEGRLLSNVKMLLPVKEGERGLRQSDALFHHTVHIPEAAAQIRKYIGGGRIVSVGVSDRPRNQVNSYMPCFLCGVSVAEGIGATCGAEVHRFSHQSGHIMAAVYSSGAYDLLEREFIAFHISGGTTELLSVTPSERGFDVEIIGGTLDLNAGQVIDRIGVAMGLAFPAGREMERLALEFSDDQKVKIPIKGCYANFSGLENQAAKMFSETKSASLVSSFVFNSIGYAIKQMCLAAIENKGKIPIVFAGGVMCNSIVRRYLCDGLGEVYFAEPQLSSDNAVGIAELARRAYIKENI